MSQTEITEKLDRFLQEHSPFSEECHALYFMVELRKLLDHERGLNGADYPRLRFYCDWAVHTRKDAKLEHIAPIIDEVYRGIVSTLRTYPMIEGHEPVMDFLYLRDLRNEISRFLESQGIPTQLIQSEEWWRAFLSVMVRVLSDQPIHNPTDRISRFMFTSATDRSAWLRADFVEPITDRFGKLHPYFEAGNAL